MTENNKLHLIEHANDILFQLVTKLKDYDIDVKASGDYEYLEDYTSLDFVEKIDELDFSHHDKKFINRIERLEKKLANKQDEIDRLKKDSLNCQRENEDYKSELECCKNKNIHLCQQKDDLNRELKLKKDKINVLAGENLKLKLNRNDLMRKFENLKEEISKLKFEMNGKEKLPKIKSSFLNEIPIDELSYEEVSESYTFNELVSLCCRQSVEIRRLKEEKRKWVSDRIRADRLSATLDEIAERCLALKGEEKIG